MAKATGILKPGQIRRPDPGTDSRPAQTFPHVALIGDPHAQQSVSLLWQQVSTLQQQLKDAIAAGNAKQTAIEALAAQLAATTTTANSAMAAAAKSTANLPQLPGQGNTAPGDGSQVGGGNTTLPAPPPVYLSYVQQAVADLVAAGIPLTGLCGSFQIVKLATWRLRAVAPTAGLLIKTGGSNCDGYAADIINFLGGLLIDVVVDGPGGGTATWRVNNETRPANQWHAPIPGAIP